LYYILHRRDIGHLNYDWQIVVSSCEKCYPRQKQLHCECDLFKMHWPAIRTNSWDNPVSIMARLWLHDQGSIPCRGGFFTSPQHPDHLWGPRASYPVGTRVPSSGVKWIGRETNCSPLSGAKVKNVWSHTSTPPPFVCMVWCLVKDQRQLYLYLLCKEEIDHEMVNLENIKFSECSYDCLNCVK
jgi:hypothetical protein